MLTPLFSDSLGVYLFKIRSEYFTVAVVYLQKKIEDMDNDSDEKGQNMRGLRKYYK